MNNLPEDIRELQRRRWQERQSGSGLPQPPEPAQPQARNVAASSASASADRGSSAPQITPVTRAAKPSATTSKPAASSSSSSSPPPGEDAAQLPELRKLHILPIAERSGRAGLQGNLEIVAPKIRELRNNKTPVSLGYIFVVQNFDYCVVGAEPERGVIGSHTEFYLDGDPLRPLDKIQFLALTELDSAKLFDDFIGPYFKEKLHRPEVKNQISEVAVASQEPFDLHGVSFYVAKTLPPTAINNVVVYDKETRIYVDPDTTPEFEKIHVVPFHDTLPRAYEYDLFNDYVKPYFKGNQHMVFDAQEHFTFQGVQFKVVCCEPPGPRRVGKSTTIFCEGVLHPSLRNLLPPELLLQLSYLPPGLQMLLLNTDAVGSGDVYERLMDVQEMLQQRRGMHPDTVEAIGSYEFDEHDISQGENKQMQCMICMDDFTHGQKLRSLPCIGSHVFHSHCIDQWLQRSTDCPICKTNIDRLVRNY